MARDDKKLRAALAAIDLVEPGSIVGIGTGSTTGYFIEALGAAGPPVAGAVASSEASAQALRRAGIRLLDLNETGPLPLYVDGADEATPSGMLIKGGGGALTREKILAAASRIFACIFDDSKLVERLGRFPLPIEVIPMAERHVARELERLGGRAAKRPGFTTDNGNVILDVSGLAIEDGAMLETELNQIAGVVANGLFCRRGADLLLVGDERGARRIDPRRA